VDTVSDSSNFSSAIVSMLKRKKLAPYVYHVALPIVAGSAIYTLWRTPSLKVFGWYEAAGLTGIINFLQQSSSPVRTLLPDWLLFSFPDGCWVYSVTAFMLLTWRESDAVGHKFLWSFAGLFCGAVIELFQYFQITSGTFDVKDIFACLLGSILAYSIVSGNFIKPFLITGGTKTA
jgi:hypothetical protein